MHTEITNLVEQFESGRISRRQFVAGVGTLVAALGASNRAVADESASTFEAVGLNHIALRVTDVATSREFYKKHLGLTVARDGGDRNCFMNCGNNFVALFRNNEAQMDHYCFSVKNYDVNDAEEKLKEHDLNPRVVRNDGRIYFKDPDGLTVQLASADHRA
jgi:catechol 2,3-dioxygenase-like lactoylglutathione lyase family enzyme